MVLHTILIREAVRYGSRFFKLEKKAFDKLYVGFPRGTGRGVRHGLTAGSAIGNILNEGNEDNKNAFPSKKPRYGSKTYKSYKTRSRRARRYCPEQPRKYRFNRKY